MKVPAIVIFDLDDTLCDYAGVKVRALAEVAVSVAEAGCDPDSYMQRYRDKEPGLFRDFASGRITRDEYRIRRFAEPFDRSIDDPTAYSRQLNDLYMEIANGSVDLFEDVEPALRAIEADRIVCAILTNGPSDGQRTKLNRSGLDRMIEHVYISEEIGTAKPSAAAFHKVTESLGIPREAAVMVGDSLQDDVRGALDAGLHAVWINRGDGGEPVQEPTIRRLTELPRLWREG